MNKIDKAMGIAIIAFIASAALLLSAVGMLLWREVLR